MLQVIKESQWVVLVHLETRGLVEILDPQVTFWVWFCSSKRVWSLLETDVVMNAVCFCFLPQAQLDLGGIQDARVSLGLRGRKVAKEIQATRETQDYKV